jgi:hypothetical protein
MWKCPKCHEMLEDTFDVCWNCGTSREGVEDPDFGKPEPDEALAESRDPVDSDDESELPRDTNPIVCPRCYRNLDFVGTKRFHEGTRLGFLGELGELFVNRERFDVYVCPRCGRAEFFVDGIGEEFRSQ